MAESTIIFTLIGMGIVTYLPRLLPAWFLRNRNLPEFVIAWLKYVPVAVLAALLLPSLLIQNQEIHFQLDNIYLWAAIPAIFVAWHKKSLFGTVITGMLIVALARFIFNL